MREIKYRGQRCKDGKWVYGSYVESNESWAGHKPHKSWILPSPMTNGGWFSVRGAYPVKEETIGQFTGLKDINGKEIYEGDIVSIFDPNDDYQGYGTVEYLEEYGVWYVCGEGSCSNNGLFDIYHEQECYYKVVGNIHDKEQKMNSDFAYCMGRIKVKIVGEETIVQEACPKRMSCKRHISVLHDAHFIVKDLPPKSDYLCWVNSQECAKRDYILYLKDDEKSE